MTVYDKVFLPQLDVIGHNAPLNLWFRGNLDALDQPMVGIVGSRSPDLYGDLIARQYAAMLADEGITVVSGFARGIDAAAHAGALSGGGKTIAVFGAGIDRWYPSMNTNLGEKILHYGGLCLSEYGPGVEPAPWQFPARNRIVAALSQVLLVVEARERSGSLITADFATKYGRPVLVCRPERTGQTFAKGSDRLVGDGHARYIDRAVEIIDVLKGVAA